MFISLEFSDVKYVEVGRSSLYPPRKKFCLSDFPGTSYPDLTISLVKISLVCFTPFIAQNPQQQIFQE